MAVKRIFIAIDISDEARERISAYMRELRAEFSHLRVGWERSEKLHMTLKFLGDIDERQLAHVRDIVGSIAKAEHPLTLELAGTGVFPNAHKARVLWVGAKRGGGEIGKIAAQIETMCRQIGFAKDEHVFSPHLTIARLRDRKSSGDLVARHLGANFEPVAFEIRELKIYESDLLPSGSIYSLVSRHKLKNGPDASPYLIA